MKISAMSLLEIDKLSGAGTNGKFPTLSELCLKTNKWGMYVGLHSKEGIKASFEDFTKAAPYLRYPENEFVMTNGFGFFLFDSEDDMKHAFDITIGDSGPTMWNDYSGPAIIYALTCGPDGVELDENT